MASSTFSVASSSITGQLASCAPQLSSSSSPFMATSGTAPLFSHGPRASMKPMAVKCSLDNSDEVPAVRKAILTGMVAMGAALSVFLACDVSTLNANAFAAMGPGTSGAERTAGKAQDLLKAADKLNVQDAPQRFGPGGISGSAQDAGKVAQNAGGKVLSQVQEGASNVASKVGEKKGEVQGAAKSKADDVTENSGGPGGILDSIKEGIQGIKESVAQKDSEAKRVLDEASSNVQGTIQ